MDSLLKNKKIIEEVIKQRGVVFSWKPSYLEYFYLSAGFFFSVFTLSGFSVAFDLCPLQGYT